MISSGRVGFARLTQVRFHLAEAARYYPVPVVLDDPVRDLLGTAAWTGTVLLVLLPAEDPAAPLTPAGTAPPSRRARRRAVLAGPRAGRHQVITGRAASGAA